MMALPLPFVHFSLFLHLHLLLLHHHSFLFNCLLFLHHLFLLLLLHNNSLSFFFCFHLLPFLLFVGPSLLFCSLLFFLLPLVLFLFGSSLCLGHCLSFCFGLSIIILLLSISLIFISTNTQNLLNSWCRVSTFSGSPKHQLQPCICLFRLLTCQNHAWLNVHFLSYHHFS